MTGTISNYINFISVPVIKSQTLYIFYTTSRNFHSSHKYVFKVLYYICIYTHLIIYIYICILQYNIFTYMWNENDWVYVCITRDIMQTLGVLVFTPSVTRHKSMHDNLTLLCVKTLVFLHRHMYIYVCFFTNLSPTSSPLLLNLSSHHNIVMYYLFFCFHCNERISQFIVDI